MWYCAEFVIIKFSLFLSPRQAVPSEDLGGDRRGIGVNFVVEESAPPTHLILADSSPP